MGGDGFHRGGGFNNEGAAIFGAWNGRGVAIGSVINSALTGDGDQWGVVVETNGRRGICRHIVGGHIGIIWA